MHIYINFKAIGNHLKLITCSMISALAILFISYRLTQLAESSTVQKVINKNVYNCQIETHFTPQEQMDILIGHELDKARHNIYLSLYGESNPILTAKLALAKRRGVDVRLAVDHLQSKSTHTLLPILEQENIPIFIKPSAILEHNKFAIIDTYRDSRGRIVSLPDSEVISGSWNWSRSANKQDNNDTFYHCPQAAIKFLETFEYIVSRDTLNRRVNLNE